MNNIENNYNTQMNEILNTLQEELNLFLEAKTVEDAFYGLIAYLHNGIKILNEVISRFDDK